MSAPKPSTPSVEEYRKYAGLCKGLAEAACDPVDKAILMQIAVQFRRLANRQAKRKKEVSSSPTTADFKTGH
jgi:hypothetical protein